MTSVGSCPNSDLRPTKGPEYRSGIVRVVAGHLQRSSYLALRDVTCDVREDVLFLRGRLPSYYLKQIAQTIVTDIEGVRGVVNQIEVIAGE